MPTSARRLTASLFIILALLAPRPAGAETLEGKYFSVKIRPGADAYGIIAKLGIGYFILPETGAGSAATAGDALSDTLDALYLEVSDIVGIHMYSLKINLDIIPSRDGLKAVLKEMSAPELDLPSYYSYNSNTIFISFEGMTAGILAHEISHAIISHYFAVPPPEKVQEILCGYVEYSINKAHSK